MSENTEEVNQRNNRKKEKTIIGFIVPHSHSSALSGAAPETLQHKAQDEEGKKKPMLQFIK